MTIQAVGWVLDHSKAKLADRLVLISIANHLSKDLGQAWISYQTMGDEAGVSRRQAMLSVQNLVGLGELAVEKGAGPKGASGGSPLNVYRMVKYLHPAHPEESERQSERQSERKAPRRVNTGSPEPRSKPLEPIGFQPKTGKTWQEMTVDEQEAVLTR